jgi:hypothetical protein
MSRKIADQLKELEEVADRKAIRISYELIGGELGAGGLCKVKGQHRVIVDKRATDGEKVTVIATALARFPLEDVFMSEDTRALIERHGPKEIAR